jgi:uncharacterized membrane protein
MITLQWLYILTGAMFAAFAVLSARDWSNRKRFGNAVFWALVATSFWFGDYLGDLGNGILVLAIVAVAGVHLVGRGETLSTSIEQRVEIAKRLGSKLFLPALIIPITAFFGTLLFNYTPLQHTGLIDPKATTLVLLGIGVLIARRNFARRKP